MTEKEI